jgi:hypothetical protein
MWGISTVILDPDEGAHAAVEWVDLASAARTAEVVVGITVEFCA